jgi:Asp-tRNA(Asn)/Glu-tRNA(Gln) amidotransferase A subunit family amidase
MQEVIQRLRTAGVKVIQNDGVELSYDQAMSSYHMVNYEFKERITDYLLSHSLANKYPNIDSLVNALGSPDVKNLMKGLQEHPSTQQQFFDAFFHHRSTVREHLKHYFDHTHADAILYPSVSIDPLKISQVDKG